MYNLKTMFRYFQYIYIYFLAKLGLGIYTTKKITKQGILKNPIIFPRTNISDIIDKILILILKKANIYTYIYNIILHKYSKTLTNSKFILI